MSHLAGCDRVLEKGIEQIRYQSTSKYSVFQHEIQHLPHLFINSSVYLIANINGLCSAFVHARAEIKKPSGQIQDYRATVRSRKEFGAFELVI